MRVKLKFSKGKIHPRAGEWYEAECHTWQNTASVRLRDTLTFSKQSAQGGIPP